MAKLERAKKHILDAESVWAAFVKGGAYTVGFKDDQNAGERTYCLTHVKEIPIDIRLIVGDAVNNLRSSLDHLAHYLMTIATGTSVSIPRVSFPIAEDAIKYRTVRRRIQGMRQGAKDAIDAIEPYGGGKGDWLWHLHELNNIDKHRLVLTVLASLRGHSMLPSERIEISRMYTGSHPFGVAPDLKGTLSEAKMAPFRLKTGDILLTIPHSEVEEQMKFALGIAFGEPKIFEGKLVVETLHHTTNLIRKLFFDFGRRGILDP